MAMSIYLDLCANFQWIEQVCLHYLLPPVRVITIFQVAYYWDFERCLFGMVDSESLAVQE